MTALTTSIVLTEKNLQGAKRALREALPRAKSSHLSEALAAALGYRTQAALLADLQVVDPSDPPIRTLDEAALAARLASILGVPLPSAEFDNLFHRLAYPEGTEVIRTWSRGYDKASYGSARGAAWRNMMVTAINAGIEQRLFTVRAGDNRWTGTSDFRQGDRPIHVYHFEVDGIPAIASVGDAGWDELSIHVGFWPTSDAERWIVAANAQFLAGEAYAAGWLERRNGAYLQTARKPMLSCRAKLLQQVASLKVAPKGYADRGSFHM